MVRAAYANREKRAHPRQDIHPPVAFSIGDGPKIEAYCRDISLGGAFFETACVPLFASEITIYVSLPSCAFEAPATVRWTGPTGMGLQFGRLGARETNALVALLSSH